MQKTFSESSLAWWSLFVLSVVLVGVYIIFFSLPKNGRVAAAPWVWDQENRVDEQVTVSKTVVPIKTWTTKEPIYSWSLASDTEHISTYTTQTVSWSWREPVENTSRTPTYIVSSQQLFTSPSERIVVDKKTTQVLPAQILYLAGTHHWKWVMKSAKFIGISSSIQYILKNNDNTHFAYIGKELPEIADTFSAMWGKSIAFTAKNDIHTHWLFGDKIIFLLVPQYIGKKQLFFVYFAEARDRWFIQVDNDIFETTKPLLRELFAKRYNRY